MDATAALGDDTAGEGIEIGIVDTAAGLPSDHAATVSIADGEDYCDLDEPDPDGHGTLVFGAVEKFARGATYRFYRLFGDGPVHATDLLLPLRDGVDDGVDVLNVSAGFRHEGEGNVRVREAIESVSSSLLLVAATGNAGSDPDESVNYPARYDRALAVGGYVSECTGRIGPDETDRRLWVDTECRRGFPDRQGPFCTQVGCSESRECGGDRLETTWSGNVEPAAGKPDVLAPPHVPERDEDGAFFVPGTSFATPMVAGIGGWLASEFDPQPGPRAIKRAIRKTAVPIHDGGKKVNARLARETLS